MRTPWLRPLGSVTVAWNVAVSPTASVLPAVAAALVPVNAIASAGPAETTSVLADTGAPASRFAPPDDAAAFTTLARLGSTACGAGMALVACNVNTTSATLRPDCASYPASGAPGSKCSPSVTLNRSPVAASKSPAPFITCRSAPPDGTTNPAGTVFRSVTSHAGPAATFCAAITNVTRSPAATSSNRSENGSASIAALVTGPLNCPVKPL